MNLKKSKNEIFEKMKKTSKFVKLKSEKQDSVSKLTKIRPPCSIFSDFLNFPLNLEPLGMRVCVLPGVDECHVCTVVRGKMREETSP